MKIIAFDPAYNKTVAYAQWNDGVFISSGKCNGVREINGLMDGCDLVCIEDQFLKFNAQTLKKLAFCSGKIQGCAEWLGIKIKIVAPTTWQSRAGLLNKKPEGIKPHRWKPMKAEMIRSKAEEICGETVIDEDEGAAILIGYAMGKRHEDK